MKFEVIKLPANGSKWPGTVMCYCKSYASALAIACSLSVTDSERTYIVVER
jgi:hypothetical protein